LLWEHQRATFLDSGRVRLVPADGLGRDQHDRVPEGYLARELDLCYANISMVTDHDVGVDGAEPVSHETVLQVFEENNARLRELLFAAIPKIGPQPDDVCATALEGARI